MAIQAALLTAEISVVGAAEAKAALQGVGQQAQQTGERAKEGGLGLSGMFKNALSFAAGGAIFAGLGFLKDQIGGIFTESMNAQAGLAQTNQVLASTHGIAGVTANAVLDLATQYSHLTQFSDDTVQASENMLLTFTNIGKNVFPQATRTVLDMSQALGQDTKNSAIQLGKARNDPIAGITALQRVGVTFSQTQKDLIKHFMDTNNIAGAQGVILQELQKEFGGSAVAAGKTFGGQLAIAGQRLDDIKQSIGDALMPVLAALLQKIGPIVDAFSQWVASGHAVSDVIAAFNAHASVLIPILVGIGAVLLGGLIAAVWSLAAGVIAATWPFLAIGAAIAGVTAIFLHFYQTNAGFKTFIDMVVNGLKQAASFVMANFIPAMQMIGAFLKNNVLPILQQVGSFLVSTFAPVWKQLVSVWNGQILPALKQLWAAIQPLKPLLEVIGMVIGTVVVIAFGLLVGIITGVVKAFAGLISGIAVAIGGIIQVFSGMVSVVSGIVSFFIGLLTGNFDKLGSDLGTIWHGIVTMFTGVWNIIKGIFLAAWGAISGFVSGLVQGVIGFFQHLFSALVGHSIIPDMINAIVGWFLSLPGKALSAVSGLLGKLMGFFGNLARQAIGWGANILANLASGIIGNIGNAIGGAMNAVGNFISSHLPSSPAKIGPLRDLATQGSKISEQIGQGMVSGMPKLQSSLNLVLTPLSMTPRSSGGPITVVVNVPPQDTYLDGVRLSRTLLPHLAAAIRYNTGGFGR